MGTDTHLTALQVERGKQLLSKSRPLTTLSDGDLQAVCEAVLHDRGINTTHMDEREVLERGHAALLMVIYNGK